VQCVHVQRFSSEVIMSDTELAVNAYLDESSCFVHPVEPIGNTCC
jgi:hypothetical protein